MTATVDRDLAQRVLDLPLPANDAGAGTVRAYLVALLAELWREEAGFSGKRPFGNSGWQYEIYGPLIAAGMIPGRLDDDGLVEDVDTGLGDRLIQAAIAELGAVR